ncbi:MAG: hypothetical protein NW703_06940 [Nitrospiraceae bacterium]
MSTKPSEVSAFKAKSRPPEPLRETEVGRSFVIRRHAKEVARLIPSHKGNTRFSPKNVAALFLAIRLHIKGPLKIRALIEGGRRL